jgi:hypothetical protein
LILFFFSSSVESLVKKFLCALYSLVNLSIYSKMNFQDNKNIYLSRGIDLEVKARTFYGEPGVNLVNPARVSKVSVKNRK